MPKTKILFVMPSLGSGGAEKSFVSLLNLLPRNIFDITAMIVNEGGLFYSHIPNDVNIINAPMNLRIALGSIHSQFMHKECTRWNRVCKLISNILVRMRTFTRLDLSQFTWNLWNKFIPTIDDNWDVAVSFMNGMTNYFVIDKVKANHKFLWVHNDYKMFKTNHYFDSKYWQQADYVATISNVCVRSLQECFPKLKDKFICLENISSTRLIYDMANDACPTEFRETKNNSVKLLSIGRLVEQKGFDMAIDAALILKNKNINFIWLIIGIGELKERLQTQINKNGLTNHVQLIGERKNPYVYMANADILVQPSRFEGKSIVLDEAKILHRPIIAANYPSVNDNIKDGVTGLICPMNAQGIAEAIEQLANDKNMQKHLSENLTKEYKGNETEIKKYISLFEGKLHKA